MNRPLRVPTASSTSVMPITSAASSPTPSLEHGPVCTRPLTVTSGSGDVAGQCGVPSRAEQSGGGRPCPAPSGAGRQGAPEDRVDGGRGGQRAEGVAPVAPEPGGAEGVGDRGRGVTDE